MNSSKTENLEVAVIAVTLSDKQMLTRLLNQAGHDAVLFTQADVLNTTQANYHAVVVCHRSSSVNPLPTLPQIIGGQRVIVFSDCCLEQTIVHTLENGAHHFFNLADSSMVLQARLEAALRQHALHTPRVLDVAPFAFNLERRSVCKDGKIINLSPKEYEFAYYLFAHRHRVVINSELMTSVWSLPSTMDARRIDTAACRVRKKMLLGESSNGWSLRRIRRVGYELLWRGESQDTRERSVGVTYKVAENKSASTGVVVDTRERETA